MVAWESKTWELLFDSTAPLRAFIRTAPTTGMDILPSRNFRLRGLTDVKVDLNMPPEVS